MKGQRTRKKKEAMCLEITVGAKKCTISISRMVRSEKGLIDSPSPRTKPLFLVPKMEYRAQPSIRLVMKKMKK